MGIVANGTRKNWPTWSSSAVLPYQNASLRVCGPWWTRYWACPTRKTSAAAITPREIQRRRTGMVPPMAGARAGRDALRMWNFMVRSIARVGMQSKAYLGSIPGR